MRNMRKFAPYENFPLYGIYENRASESWHTDTYTAEFICIYEYNWHRTMWFAVPPEESTSNPTLLKSERRKEL